MSDSDLEVTAVEQDKQATSAPSQGEPDLGVPDFSSIMDDDEAEITSTDIDGNKAKAPKGLKPSFAVEKLMPIIFDAIAVRGGDHWRLHEEEVKALGESLDETLEYYFPDMSDLPPWASLAVVAGFIFVPRIIMGFDGKDSDENETSDNEKVGTGTVLRPEGA